jgi:hypothetical protein
MKALIPLFVFFLTNPVFAQDFRLVPNESIALNGYDHGLRTVWFSNDNTQLLGDSDHLLKWHIQSGKLLQKTEIPGYSTLQSTVDAQQSKWVQANGNYNNPNKKDITDMHSNLNVFAYAYDQMNANKIEAYYIKDHAFLPNRDNQLLVMVSLPESYLYSLKIFSLTEMKEVATIATTKNSKDLMICLDVSEDGKKAAVGYAGKSSRIELYDLENLQLIKSFPTEGEVHKVRIANGVAVGAGEKKLTVIDLNSNSKVKSIETNEGCFALALSPNGKTAAIGDRFGSELIDIESEKATPLYEGQCQSLCFDHKGNMVAVGVFKSMHLADIPSAHIFFNANKHEEKPVTNSNSVQAEEISTEIEWYKYKNVNPNFSVFLPTEPEVKSFTSKSGVRQTQIKSLGSKNGVLINIAEAKKVKSKAYLSKSQEIAKKFVENMGDGTKNIKTESTTLSGSEGTAYSFTKGRFQYNYKCAIIDGYLYQLTFFTSTAESEDHLTFFESFKI